MAEQGHTRPRRLDSDALAAAREAVYDRWQPGSSMNIAEVVEVAVNAYMEDIIRQLDLKPCEDCEDQE